MALLINWKLLGLQLLFTSLRVLERGKTEQLNTSPLSFFNFYSTMEEKQV